MTIQECYEAMGENYAEVKERLMSDAMIKKFVIKFLQDKSFDNLCDGISSGDGEKAFMGAHTLKGLSQNLGFMKLYKVTSDITEQLRGRSTAGCDKMLELVQLEYCNLANVIKKMQEEG